MAFLFLLGYFLSAKIGVCKIFNVMASGNYVALENFIKQGFYKYTIAVL